MTRQPLAEALRPINIDDFSGQEHLLGPGNALRQIIDNKQLHSMVLWGPSGSGKTTLAKIISSQIDGYYAELSAVLGGVKELRDIVENANKFENIGKKTILFVDEIHRFNKSQQDAFLPHIESGLITLIGATTENPSFELNSALLSRLSVYILKPLDEASLNQILSRALDHESLDLNDESIKSQIVRSSKGDARRVINIVEQISLANLSSLDANSIGKILQDKTSSFDKNGDIFYQQLSAFHKSVRGSSPDAALYWMARMLVGGCEATIIARRLLAIASEDIGNADPRALEITLNAWNIYSRVGRKEGDRAIAQAAVYCAVAPKSNALYLAFNVAMDEAKSTCDLPVPKHLCNPTTSLMKGLGHGEGYRYAHNESGGVALGQKYFPERLGEREYYFPTERGLEIKISEKLKQLRGSG